MKTPTSHDQTEPSVEVNESNSDMFAERIKILSDEAGNDKTLARLCNISPSVVGKWRKKLSEPSRDYLIAVSKGMNVNIQWLVTGEGPMRQGDKSQLQASEEVNEKSRDYPQNDYYYLPLYDVRASAGHGALNHSENVVDMLAFKRQWIRQELGAQAESLCLLYVTGESMEPALHANDVVLVDRSIKDVTTDGIYVLVLDGTLLIKRCQRVPGRKIRISSDNQAYESFTLDDNMHTTEQHLIGRVVWAGRKF